MQEFEYAAARSVSEVLALLGGDRQPAVILGGGTDLLVQLREGRREARLVVDIKGVPQVNELRCSPGDGLWVGSAVSCKRFCSDPQVARLYPGLVDAVSVIGGVQIQGRASIGGNVCNASPAADSIPALIVHRAVCVVEGQQERREIPMEAFCAAPGKSVLRDGEFLLGLRVPPPPAGFGARYLRFIPRNEMDIAVVGAGAAVVLSHSGNRIVQARLALAAVAPTPLLVEEAGKFLEGKEIASDAVVQAAQMAQAAAQPIADMRGSEGQRKQLAFVLSRRALEGAIQRALLSLK